jgi:hypothetical protein
MDKPTLRVLHGVFTAPVVLDSDLAHDELRRFPQHHVQHPVEPPRRNRRPARAVMAFYEAIVAALTTVRVGRPRHPLRSVVAAEDRASS